MQRRRLLLIAIAGATSLVPVTTRGVAAAADRPRPDVQYVYDQIAFMSSQYLMRDSGFDGPPGDLNPQDGNLPPLVNGWQEFYQHWREQMQSPTVMGSFVRHIHYDDHLFPTTGAPFLSDAATVTIPGASCPGETVLVAGHPDSTPGANTGNGSTYDDTSGVVMGIGELSALTRWWQESGTWPARTIKVGLFDAEETGLNGSQYYASHLLPPGPQGRYVLVANMDQNGLEYPAYPAGTRQTTWGPNPWYTNINASPIKDFSIYSGSDGKPLPAILANMPAIKHFRQALDQEVRIAFADLGRKYNFSIPLENPIENGAAVPAYLPGDVDTLSPVQDDSLGRTDQVPFVAAGIPGYGVVGAYDSNPQDNPLSTPATALTPLGAAGLPQIAGYDTPRDNIIHYNLMTSGTTGGSDGSIAVKRALELPMTWTLGLLSRPEYVGRSSRPAGPIAYFEALPAAAKAGAPVSFNAAAAVDIAGGGLTYAWSFGDGTAGSGPAPTHTFAHDGWYDTRLIVRDAAGHASGYHASVRVGSPNGPAPITDACGVVASAGSADPLAVASTSPPILSPGAPNTAAAGAAPTAITTLLAVGGAAARLRRRRRILSTQTTT